MTQINSFEYQSDFRSTRKFAAPFYRHQTDMSVNSRSGYLTREHWNNFLRYADDKYPEY